MRTFRIIGHGPGRLSCLGIASLSFLLAAQASAAIDLSSVQNVSGAWEISLRDTERRCTFVLRQENINSGKAIAMPAGCRRALPALADVGSWILSSQQKAITLADTDGLPVLSFAPQSEGSLIATGPIASPSSPSVRLTALLAPTMTIVAKGMNQIQRSG